MFSVKYYLILVRFFGLRRFLKFALTNLFSVFLISTFKVNCNLFSEQVLDEIQDNGIKIYTFPECDSEDDEEFIKINQDLKVCFVWLISATAVGIFCLCSCSHILQVCFCCQYV